jgi:hypothetical protein
LTVIFVLLKNAYYRRDTPKLTQEQNKPVWRVLGALVFDGHASTETVDDLSYVLDSTLFESSPRTAIG